MCVICRCPDEAMRIDYQGPILANTSIVKWGSSSFDSPEQAIKRYQANFFGTPGEWVSEIGYRVGSTSGPIWRGGTGTPEGAVTAPVGSIFSRTDGGASTTFYVKESGAGNTGWVAK